MLAFPLVAAPVLLIARSTARKSFDVRGRMSVLCDAILQILRGIRIIKVYRGEEEEARRTIGCARYYYESALEVARTEALAQVFLESVAGFSLVVVVIAGGFQVLPVRFHSPLCSRS